MSHSSANPIDNASPKDAARPRPRRSSTPAGGATPMAGKADGPPPAQAAQTRIPKGPFKTLTIPDCWYNSLHAASGTGGKADGEQQ